MRLLKKDTELEVAWFTWRWQPSQPTVTVVVKATFELADDGPCTLASAQDAPCGELYHDDDPAGSLRRDSDLAPFKPRGDCVVLGSFHSPTGQPVTQSQIAFQIGAVRKNIAVFGDRRWTLAGASAPEPFVTMPLTWERAYGGPGFSANPLGRGIARQRDGAALLPNLEDPQQLVQAKGEHPRPMCPGPMPRSFPSRMRLAGTYDQRWQRERYPDLPEDLSWDYFVAAPPDQQIQGYWRGNESIVLVNLVPGRPRVQCHLPGVWPRALLVPAGAPAQGAVEVDLRLDTISIDADAGRLHASWRGPREVPSESLEEYAYLVVTHDVPDGWRDEAALRAAVAEALEEEGTSDAQPESPDAPPEAAGSADREPSAQPLFKTMLGAELKWAHLDQALTAGVAQAQPDMLRELAGLLRQRGLSPDALGGKLSEAMKSVIEPEPAQKPIDEDELRALEERVLREEEELAQSSAGRELRRRVQEALFRGESCAGWDLTEVDLSRLRLSGGDFRGARFVRASLAGTIFSETFFEGALFEESELSDANFHGASLAGAAMENCRLERTHFGDCTLDDASITGSFLRDARFTRSYGRRLELTGSYLERITFDDSVFSGADFSGATLDDALFARTDLSDAWMIDGVSAKRMRLQRCDLELLRAFGGTDFEETRFAACVANGAHFEGAKLGGVDLSFSELERADFTDALLFNAKLMGCRLRQARFDGAKLAGASLIKSDLYQARFERADLTGADLRGANLYQAELLDATLTGVQLELANLAGTRIARMA